MWCHESKWAHIFKSLVNYFSLFCCILHFKALTESYWWELISFDVLNKPVIEWVLFKWSFNSDLNQNGCRHIRQVKPSSSSSRSWSRGIICCCCRRCGGRPGLFPRAEAEAWGFPTVEDEVPAEVPAEVPGFGSDSEVPSSGCLEVDGSCLMITAGTGADEVDADVEGADGVDTGGVWLADFFAASTAAAAAAAVRFISS